MADDVVNVIDPATAEVSSIPSVQLKDALSQGYTQASQEDVQNFFDKQKYETPGQQLKTGLEGAASAATLGLSTAVEKAAGVNPEDIQNRRKYNPGVHSIGQIGGLAATSLIPGFGEAGLAEELGTAGAKEALGATKTAAEINPFSAQSVMSGLAERGSQALGLEGIPGAATKGAIENAIFQGGDEISKMFSNDPDQSLQTAVTNVGLAGLLGGGLGATGSAAEKLWDAKFGGKTSEFLGDFKSRLQEHLNNPNPVSTLSEELQNRVNSSADVFDEVYGSKGLKADAIEKLMPHELSDKMVGQAQDLLGKSKALAQTMESNPDLFPNYARASFNRDLRVFSDSLSEPKSPGELFNAVQDFKQRLDASLPQKGEIPSPAEREWIQSGRNLAGDIRKNLQDPAVWGKAGEVQQSINKAFSEYLTPLKQFRGKFMTKVGDDFQIDPGKVQTYLNQTGKAGQKVKQEMLGAFLNADQAYREAINSTHAKLGVESPFPESSVHYSKSTLEELTPGARLADAFVKKGLSRLVGESAGLGIGAGVGHALGSGFIGALIGEHALAPFFNSILPSLVKPLLENSAQGGAFKDAIQMGLNVVKGESLVNKAAKGVFKATQEVLPETLLPSEKKRDKLEKLLKNYQTDPIKLTETENQSGHYLPGHATALAQTSITAVQYLNSLRPDVPKQSPLDSKLEPSVVQKEAYDRALNIAEQPLIVLNHLKAGTMIPQDLVTLKTIYPSLYGSLQQKLMNEMMNSLSKGNQIPYRTRMGLSLFMGQPLDSTLGSQGILSSQSTFQQNVSPTQKAPEARSGHSMKALSKISEIDRTPNEARQMSRSKL